MNQFNVNNINQGRVSSEPLAPVSEKKVGGSVLRAAKGLQGRAVSLVLKEAVKIVRAFTGAVNKSDKLAAPAVLTQKQVKPLALKDKAQKSDKSGSSKPSARPAGPSNEVQDLVGRSQQLKNRSDKENETLIQTLKNRKVGQAQDAKTYAKKFGEDFSKPENRRASQEALKDPLTLNQYARYQASIPISEALKSAHQILDTRQELKEALKNRTDKSNEEIAQLKQAIQDLKPIASRIHKALDQRNLFEKIALPR